MKKQGIEYKITEPDKHYEVGDTIEIILCSEDNKECRHTYKYQTMDSIKKMVDSGQDISLDGCYIKNFSYPELISLQKEPLELKNFSAEKSFFDGFTDFNAAVFCETAFFESAIFGGCVEFCEAIFSDYTSFYKAVFCRLADFSSTIFYDYASFQTIHFDTVCFSDSIFCGSAWFESTTFHDCVDFNRTTFYGSGVFWKTIFKATSSFNSSIFCGSADFQEAIFYDDARFFNVTFKDIAEFIDAAILDQLKFYGSIFFGKTFLDRLKGHGRIAFLKCSFKNELTLNSFSVKTLMFYNCQNYGFIDMFSKPKKIEGLAFIDVTNYGQIKLNWMAYKTALTYKINTDKMPEITESGKEDYHPGQFQMLKTIFHDTGAYEWEDEAYAAFKRAERKQEKFPATIGSWLFDKICGYGTKPLYVLRAMMLVICFFAVLFSNKISGIQINYGMISDGFMGAFFCSMINFFTVGFCDIKPLTDLAVFLAFIENILSVFLMALFSVTFIRKIFRN